MMRMAYLQCTMTILGLFFMAFAAPLAGDALPLRVALIPPVDAAPTVSTWQAMARRCGFELVRLTPAQFVSHRQFSADRFALAIYAGAERYCHTVQTPGDGLSALERYLDEGGTLLVAGRCWPFYRPVDFVNGNWVPSRGTLPAFRGKDDKTLREQMARLKQNPRGNFNRFLGLDIAGRGTTQFEKPEEPVWFVRAPGAAPFFQVPEKIPFPAAGDRRFRPVSVYSGLPNRRVEPLLVLVGESGTRYGAGAAVVTENNPPDGRKNGAVIYIWGTLFASPQADALARGVLRLVMASRELSPKQMAAVTAARKTRADLERRCKNLGGALAHAVAGRPEIPYLRRQRDSVLALLGRIGDVLLVANTERAKPLLAVTAARLERLEKAAAAAQEK